MLLHEGFVVVVVVAGAADDDDAMGTYESWTTIADCEFVVKEKEMNPSSTVARRSKELETALPIRNDNFNIFVLIGAPVKL